MFSKTTLWLPHHPSNLLSTNWRFVLRREQFLGSMFKVLLHNNVMKSWFEFAILFMIPYWAHSQPHDRWLVFLMESLHSWKWVISWILERCFCSKKSHRDYSSIFMKQDSKKLKLSRYWFSKHSTYKKKPYEMLTIFILFQFGTCITKMNVYAR